MTFFYHDRIKSNSVLFLNYSLMKKLITNEIFRQFINFLLASFLSLTKSSTMTQKWKSIKKFGILSWSRFQLTREEKEYKIIQTYNYKYISEYLGDGRINFKSGNFWENVFLKWTGTWLCSYSNSIQHTLPERLTC